MEVDLIKYLNKQSGANWWKFIFSIIIGQIALIKVGSCMSILGISYDVGLNKSIGYGVEYRFFG